MTAFLPIVENCQTSRVMLIGHTDAQPLPKELLSIYLALAGLAGTAAERKRAEEEVRRLNAELGAARCRAHGATPDGQR